MSCKAQHGMKLHSLFGIPLASWHSVHLDMVLQE